MRVSIWIASRGCIDPDRRRNCVPSATSEIPSESVDNVENPGREHVLPVDNLSGVVVAHTACLLESAPFHGDAFSRLFFEKPLVIGGVPRNSLPGCGWHHSCYPQTCQPFCGGSSTAGRPNAAPNQLPTGPWVMERPRGTSAHRNLHVRCMFDAGERKRCPHMWKALWITQETAVKRMSRGLSQDVNETSGYAFYLVFLKEGRCVCLWTVVWSA